MKTEEQKAKHAAYMREWNAKNKEKKKDRDRIYYEKNKDKVKENVKKYKQANPEKKKEWDAGYRERNAYKIKSYTEATKDMQKVRSKRKYEKNKDKILAEGKLKYQENKEVILKRNAEWREKNRDKVRAKQREYKKMKLATDPAFRLIEAARRRMLNALKGVGSKSARTIELLGCTGEECVSHLTAKFKEGMSWENRSEWHIDHIRPLASFDLSDPEQQKIAFHYTNLQPLWKLENIRKGAKYA